MEKYTVEFKHTEGKYIGGRKSPRVVPINDHLKDKTLELDMAHESCEEVQLKTVASKMMSKLTGKPTYIVDFRVLATETC